MPNTPEVGSPEWWRDALLEDLKKQQAGIDIYDEYYEGEHRLAFATSKFRRAFGDLFAAFADNWCDLIVDAVDERLDVIGFRFGDPETADDAAWEIWQRNQMDSMSQQGHLESLINGTTSVSVWQDGGQPTINVEHPSQMVVRTDPATPNARVAALKHWEDDWGTQLCTLYLPNGIFKWERKARSNWLVTTGWTERQVNGEDWPLPNPLGVVPVVPLVNRPRILKPGKSEIHSAIPVQDAVNKLVADMMVASEYQAFRQRWATGLELPTILDQDGNPVPQEQTYRQAIDRLWVAEDPETTFGEFASTSPSTYVESVEMLVQHLASQSRTPPHYFYLSGQFPSGESIKSAETGLVAKAKRKQRFYGETWEEVMRLAFAVQGDTTKAAQYDAETIWADPESRTESEHVDAVSKKAALNVPVQALWEEFGYTPAQIARFRVMLQTQATDVTAAATLFSNALDSAGAQPGGNGDGQPATVG